MGYVAPGDSSGERTVAENRDPLLGTLVDGRFRIDFRLAAGGFGAIYIAADTRSGKEVALKVLHASLVADPAIARRFRREGALLAKLRNPHTVRAYELGELAGGGLFIVMELLRGQTLFDRLSDRGPFPWQQVVEIGRDVCSSLGEAHSQGIVHRDLKLANIFLERCGEIDVVKVLDFGIAKILRGSDVAHTQLTIAGALFGTLEYMSPEQLQGEQCTVRSDIYALGVVMYELLVGWRPFATSEGPQLLAAMQAGAPRPKPATPMPAELERIVLRCLAYEPRDRFKHVKALSEALERLITDEENTNTVPARDSDEAPTWFDPRRPQIVARKPEPVPEPTAETRALAPWELRPRPAASPVPAPSPAVAPSPAATPMPDYAPLQVPSAAPARNARPPAKTYSLAATMEQEALFRRIMWGLVIVAIAVIAIVLAVR